MSTASRAVSGSVEIRKLAHTLGVPPERLEPLAAASAEDLRQLRAQVAEALFQADRPRFAKIAALSKAVPVAVSAKLTELAFPPLLAARTAELIDPAKAAELVSRLSDRYLADVSAAMDPARCPAVVAGIPAERIGMIAAELARRSEWVVIAGFIDQVTGPALRESVEHFNGAQLLHVGFVLDDKTRLDEINAMLSEDQRDDLLAAAASEGLWSELEDMIAYLGPLRREQLARSYAAAPVAVRRAVPAAAKRGELSASALAVLSGAG